MKNFLSKNKEKLLKIKIFDENFTEENNEANFFSEKKANNKGK